MRSFVAGAAIIAALAGGVGFLLHGTGGHPTGHASVVDLVRYRGTTYTAGRSALPHSLLGPRIAVVKRRLHVDDTNPGPPRPLTMADTVSTTYPRGTAIHSVRGYRCTFRIAVVSANRIGLYEARFIPRPVRGADVLDINGKLRRIDIADDRDRTLGRIRDPRLLRVLSAQIADARALPDLPLGHTDLFLTFILRDGTAITRTLVDRAYLRPGILVAAPFVRAVLEAAGQPH